MVLFFCLIPNRGARIGHQSYEHFLFVTYCKVYNFNFVYYPFTCNSAKFENVLKFNTLYQNNYESIKDSYTIIKLEDIKDNLHSNLLEIHEKPENIMVYGPMCGNEEISSVLDKYITMNNMIETKLNYRKLLDNSYYKKYDMDYICIHIRCGDVMNDPTRYLSEDYFIDMYKKLVEKMPHYENMKIIVMTESNFNKKDKILENIQNCEIINCDEINAFYIMVNSTVLIASRSGFSNLAYILGHMMVVIPPNDWNQYYDNVINI